MKLEYTADALEDLVEIELRGILNFGTRQTENYLAKIEHSIGLILDSPRLAQERQDTLRPVRIRTVGAHVIVYEVFDEHIRIVRIIYGRQNWQENL
jgi:plasmid stabilization system protein ParE